MATPQSNLVNQVTFLGHPDSTTADPSHIDQPLISNQRARLVLQVLNYTYPIALLLFFLVVFTARSVYEVERAVGPPSEPQIGPGGRRLPPARRPVKKNPDSDLDFSKNRKLLFEWLSFIVAGTFIANAVNVIVHACVERNQNWWCGKAVVVSEP